jgi:TPR repeat protein
LGGRREWREQGVPKDVARATTVFQKGCDLGLGAACLRLGLMCDVGFGVPKDTARANALFKKGCPFDNAQACEFVRR